MRGGLIGRGERGLGGGGQIHLMRGRGEVGIVGG